jgi:hypothetical protein
VAEVRNLDEAMALYKEQERILRETGNKAGLQACLTNQAALLEEVGEMNEEQVRQALALRKEVENICRELGLKRELSKSLVFQAVHLGIGKHNTKVTPLLEEAYLIESANGVTQLSETIKMMMKANKID